jgi:hypothetical protein
LTHSPEPIEGEYLNALTWEAATKRLEAAGSIPVKEAELMKDALSSDEAGVEVGRKCQTGFDKQMEDFTYTDNVRILDNLTPFNRRRRRKRSHSIWTAKVSSKISPISISVIARSYAEQR